MLLKCRQPKKNCKSGIVLIKRKETGFSDILIDINFNPCIYNVYLYSIQTESGNKFPKHYDFFNL